MEHIAQEALEKIDRIETYLVELNKQAARTYGSIEELCRARHHAATVPFTTIQAVVNMVRATTLRAVATGLVRVK